MTKLIFHLFYIAIAFFLSFSLGESFVFASVRTPDNGEKLSSVGTPDNLFPCHGVEVPFVGLTTEWDDVLPSANHYELYYKLTTKADWTDAYPGTSQFDMPGLQPGPAEYEWYVVSCGDADCADSAASGICLFTTMEFAAPPGDSGGGGPGGGGPSNGGPGDGREPIITPSDLNPISSQTLPQLLENVLNFLFGLSLVILPIIILYGGILMLTAGGSPEKISKARTILLWAVVAFAIILLARGLPAVLRNLL